MKVALLVSDACAPCVQAERVWHEVAAECALVFTVVNLDRPDGRALAERLQIKTIPALVVDDVLVAIGVQTLEEARALIASKQRNV